MMIAAFAGTAVPVSQATVPTAPAGSSVITVKVGGVRTSSTQVTPLAGVTLQLHNGGKSNSVGAPVTDSWGSCTSDAQGDCSFIVPDTAVGGANYNNRFYIEQTGGAPSGWYENTTIDTSSDMKDSTYLMRTGAELWAGKTYTSTADFPITPSGGRSSNGIWAESLANPALPPQCGINAAIIMDLSASVNLGGPGGSSALPQLKAAASGLTDALGGTNSQVALFTFGTHAPAQFPMNANRPLTPVSTTAGAAKVDSWINGIAIPGTGGDAGGIGSVEATNWDQGLYQVAQQQSTTDSKLYDLAIIITDGNPTRFGDTGGNGADTRFAEVEEAVFSANAIKQAGTRVIAVGVGDAVNSQHNLAAISGPTANSDYYAVDWSQAADTVKKLALQGCAATPGTASMTVVKQVVSSKAGGGVDYTTAVPASGWTINATPTGGSATASPASGVTVTGTGATSFNIDLGAAASAEVTFKEDPMPANPGLTEYEAIPTPSGANADCVVKSLADGSETPLALTNSTDPEGSFSVNLTSGQVASCTIYNQSSTPPATVTVNKTWVINGQSYPDGTQPLGFSSSFGLTTAQGDYSDMSWGVTYTDWTPGTTGQLTEKVSLPASCHWQNNASNTTPNGPTGSGSNSFTGVTQERTAPAGAPGVNTIYNLAAPTTPATPALIGYNQSSVTGYTETLVSGDNVWSITNSVACTPMMQLVKALADGIGSDGTTTPLLSAGLTAADFNLMGYDLTDPSAQPLMPDGLPTCQQPGQPDCSPVGPVSVREPLSVVPGHTYALTESPEGASAVADTYLQWLDHTAAGQPDDPATPDDDSSKPTINKQSSGSWGCISSDANVTNGVFTNLMAQPLATGTVTIGYDIANLYCIAMNASAEFYATKTITGGQATVADWSYSLTPVTTSTPADGGSSGGETGDTATDGPKTKVNSDTGEPEVDLQTDYLGSASDPNAKANPGLVDQAFIATGANPTAADAHRLRPMTTYKVSENGAPDGYTLTDVICDWTAPLNSDESLFPAWDSSTTWTKTSIMHPPADSGLTPMQLTLYPGRQAHCEFINTKNPTLTLVKQVDQGSAWMVGTAKPTAWTLTATNTADASASISGATGDKAVTAAQVSAGQYTLSESGGPTLTAAQGSYQQKQAWDCVNASGANVPMKVTGPGNGASATPGNTIYTITVAAGDAITCTVENEFIAPVEPQLTLQKTVINGSGATAGTANKFAWKLTATSADGKTSISGKTFDASVSAAAVPAGSYQLSESAGPTTDPAKGSYALTGWACTDQTGAAVTLTTSADAPGGLADTLSLGMGDRVTCTATNTWTAAAPPQPPAPPESSTPPEPPASTEPPNSGGGPGQDDDGGDNPPNNGGGVTPPTGPTGSASPSGRPTAVPSVQVPSGGVGLAGGAGLGWLWLAALLVGGGLAVGAARLTTRRRSSKR
jgi:hypothetical protein